MTALEEIHFDTAPSFLDFLRPISAVWGEGDSIRWIFRGQANAAWQLLPRAWRGPAQSQLGPLVDYYLENLKNGVPTAAFLNYARRCNIIKDELEDFYNYIAECASEHEAVSQFALLLDELGLPFPLSDEVMSGRSFIDRALSSTQIVDVAVSDGAGIAQHHGIPTRLLDWTRKPLVAAYFASQMPSASPAENIAVWAVDVSYLKKMDKSHGIRIITSSRAQDPYLRAQDGLFIASERAGVKRLRNNSWPTLIEIISDSYQEGDSPLKKLTLPVHEVQELESLLWRERVSLAHLMPSHDNAARLAIAQWSRRRRIYTEVSAYEWFDD